MPVFLHGFNFMGIIEDILNLLIEKNLMTKTEGRLILDKNRQQSVQPQPPKEEVKDESKGN